MSDPNSSRAVELPKPNPQSKPESGAWGSDAIAEMLRDIGYPYVALNPGSSFRGLHDSLVNHLGNSEPQMLLCLHEEHAVALAHGWAKVTGTPLAVILHANVGLMHGSMAIYNAWCDRVPVIILGATGPVDAAQRRPWIDWIHTSRDQASIIRPYVKWDDQPASIAAALDAIVRADTVARTAPSGPTYVCLDVSLQEAAIDGRPDRPDPSAFARPAAPGMTPAQVAEARALLDGARAPVIMMGRMSRAPREWGERVALAEHYGAHVLTDIKTGAVFPTDHDLHVGPPSFFLSPPQAERLRAADLILALDWVDAAGALAQAGADAPVINVSMYHRLANGWSLDHGAQVQAALHFDMAPDGFVSAMVEALVLSSGEPDALATAPAANEAATADPMSMSQFASCIGQGLAGETVCLVRLPLGWDCAFWHFRHPLDHLGYDGGAGIGSGPGMLVGAALALRETNRLPVAILGDGDVMMGVSALWTAARYHIPMLAIVCNNRSYYNDEVHQEKVARMRDRPVENKWIGQAITGPDIDLAAMATAQGLMGIGPVTSGVELVQAVRDAVTHVKAGAAVLIDARVEPGYAEAMAKGMTEDE